MLAVGAGKALFIKVESVFNADLFIDPGTAQGLNPASGSLRNGETGKGKYDCCGDGTGVGWFFHVKFLHFRLRRRVRPGIGVVKSFGFLALVSLCRQSGR